MYKLLGFQGYFNVEELPDQVKIFERTVNLEIMEENLHDSVAVYEGSFLTDSNVLTTQMSITAQDAYYFNVVMQLLYLNI